MCLLLTRVMSQVMKLGDAQTPGNWLSIMTGMATRPWKHEPHHAPRPEMTPMLPHMHISEPKYKLFPQGQVSHLVFEVLGITEVVSPRPSSFIPEFNILRHQEVFHSI